MYLWPQVLPGSKAVLFAATNANGQGSLLILTPNDGKIRTVVENSTYGRYLASGYLIYFQRGTLFAAPMDARRLELTGAAVPLVDGVSRFEGGRADFDVSSSGTLVYQRGTERSRGVLSWLDSSGKITPVLSAPGEYSTPRLSPDGTRLALSVLREGKQNIWVYDLSRETFTRLTTETGPDSYPTWTADGEFVFFQSGNVLAWTRSDGSGKVERLAGINNAGPWSLSADGKWLAFWPLQPGSDLWAAPVERKPGVLRLGQPQPLLQQAGSQGAPAISPDDRWVAYSSDETGRFEIYVMPFSPLGKAAERQMANLERRRMEPQVVRQWPRGVLSKPRRPAGSGGKLHGQGRFVRSRKTATLVRSSRGSGISYRIRCCARRQASVGADRCRGCQARNAPPRAAQRGQRAAPSHDARTVTIASQ